MRSRPFWSPQSGVDMRIVVALGGNALLRRGEPMNMENQRRNVGQAAAVIAKLASAGHCPIVTHGNGPQVGLLALQSASQAGAELPLDVLDAESAGMIGYLLQQELRNALPGRLVATVLTQVRVDVADPAFLHPTKPIGLLYEEDEAHRLSKACNWQMAQDNDKWRRVVPSPRPLEILEHEVISMLVDREVIVICAGGGGIPVRQTDAGALAGVEAVVDKDLASSLLARHLKADLLLMLTDVDAVYLDYGSARARPLRTISADDIRHEDFAPGSMGPKVAAAAEFAKFSGKTAIIGRLDEAVDLVNGKAGTRIHAAASSPVLVR